MIHIVLATAVHCLAMAVLGGFASFVTVGAVLAAKRAKNSLTSNSKQGRV